MKNRDKWVPSRFIYKKGILLASRDSKEVGISSRLPVNIMARFYDTYIKEYVRGKLIDLGCGKVPLFEAYKDYITDNVCVDWENTAHKSEYLDFECDLTKRLPFPDEEFDTIILSDVLEHIPQPDFLWKEIARILSNKGKILANAPFYYGLHEPPYDYYRYTEFALRRFVDFAGLNLVLLKSTGGAPEILADILAKSLLHLPHLGKFFAILVQQFASLFIKTKFGKKVSEITSRNFSFGYFLVAEKSN